MDTLVCPKGHINMENNLHSNVNRGLRCLTCEDVMICDGCTHKVTRIHGRNGLTWPGVRWIGSMELAELGIIKRGNPADGGVYALCPQCKQKTMHKEGRTSWYDLEAFRRDGGKWIRLDVLPRESQCKSYVVADAEITILCDVHAEGYRKIVNKHGLVPIGTPESGADARCTMCYNRKPTVGGIVMSGRVLIDGKPYESYAAVLAEMDRQQREAGLPGLDEQAARYRDLERDTMRRIGNDRRAVWTHEPGGPVRPDDMQAPDLKVGEPVIVARWDSASAPAPAPDAELEATIEREIREALGYVPAELKPFLADNAGRIAGVRVIAPPEVTRPPEDDA